jgi:beta-carotene hydroxylase
MHLRNAADYRSVLWVALAVAAVALQYALPHTVLFVLPFSCYLGIACGVIAHNHNHCPTFARSKANHAFGHILTVFYGYPTLMWIPTHNMNHHRFVNRPGDATITWRYTNGHNLFIALTYFFVSSYFQSGPIQRYIDYAREHNRRLYGRIMFQYAVWLVFVFGTLALALAISPRWGMGLLLWIGAVVIPSVCSLSMIMFFNYIQHVHADAYSTQDHSRNFTGKIFNYLFFNNGYHTAHHDNPNMHWSALPAAHARIAGTIEPRLNERNLLSFFFKQYVLAPLFPRLGTHQLGPEPSDIVAQEIAAAQEAAPESLELKPLDLKPDCMEPAHEAALQEVATP